MATSLVATALVPARTGRTQGSPLTFKASCPIGYTDQQVLGTRELDYEIHVCYKRREVGDNTPPDYPFGGMWGQVNGGTYVPNPATGIISCPEGFKDKQVLGTGNVDFEAHVCSSRP